MASKYYHKCNVLKFRILEVLVQAKKPMTAKEIAEAGKIDYKRVCSALCHYKKENNFPFINRLKKKGANGAYRYKITKSGLAMYIAYRRRIELGVDLNRYRKVPVKVDAYYGCIKPKEVDNGNTEAQSST